MPLEIVSLTLGPAQTNSYLIAASGAKEAVSIDPSWDGHIILDVAKQRGWRITSIWLTHAHFDHFGGAAAVGLRLAALHRPSHPGATPAGPRSPRSRGDREDLADGGVRHSASVGRNRVV